MGQSVCAHADCAMRTAPATTSVRVCISFSFESCSGHRLAYLIGTFAWCTVPPNEARPRRFDRLRARILLMPTEHIIALLITERDKLNRAIEALQAPATRLGRPP